LLTKATFLAFIPVVLLLVVIVEWRKRKHVGAVLLSLGIIVVLFLTIGSYKYVENYRHFGDPFIHNTDPLVQDAIRWHWADGQKNTYRGVLSFFDWNIGKLMLHPTIGEATRHSYFLILYGSFWYQYIFESNLMGNKTVFQYFGSVIYCLALVPTLVFFVGVYALFKKSVAAVRNRKLENSFIQRLFSVLVFFATLSLIIYIGIRTDVWSCFQSRLAFPAFWGVVVLFSSGLEIIEWRQKMASVVYWLFNVLFVCFVLYFVIELLIIVGLPF